LQTHCQSRTCQRFNQSFVKELAMPTHGGQDITANLTDKINEDKNRQCLTCNIQNWGLIGYSRVVARIKFGVA